MTTLHTEGIRGGRRPRRWRSRYGREIAVVLAVKTVALVAIWQLFFAAPRPHVDGPAVAARIYSSDGAAAPARERHAGP